jgi:DNA-binding PadR family transcriptional regulator
MPELGAPAYVVLGMVRLGARSGYEIKQAVENSIRFFWTISQAQIYPSLHLLEEAGLITGRADPQGRRPRRVFQTTEAGEAALRDWLTRDEPMPFELRDTGLLKVFFADALDREQALALLRAVRQRSADRVRTLRAIEPAAKAAEAKGNLYPGLTLQLGIAYHQAIIDVCADFERHSAASPSELPAAYRGAREVAGEADGGAGMPRRTGAAVAGAAAGAGVAVAASQASPARVRRTETGTASDSR